MDPMSRRHFLLVGSSAIGIGAAATRVRLVPAASGSFALHFIGLCAFVRRDTGFLVDLVQHDYFHNHPIVEHYPFLAIQQGGVKLSSIRGKDMWTPTALEKGNEEVPWGRVVQPMWQWPLTAARVKISASAGVGERLSRLPDLTKALKDLELLSKPKDGFEDCQEITRAALQVNGGDFSSANARRTYTKKFCKVDWRLHARASQKKISDVVTYSASSGSVTTFTLTKGTQGVALSFFSAVNYVGYVWHLPKPGTGQTQTPERLHHTLSLYAILGLDRAIAKADLEKYPVPYTTETLENEDDAHVDKPLVPEKIKAGVEDVYCPGGRF